MSDDLPRFDPDPDADPPTGDTGTRIPWLPAPFECDDCGVVCEQTTEYSTTLYEPVPAWTCPECGQSYHRE